MIASEAAELAKAAPAGFPLSFRALAMSSVDGRPPPPPPQAVRTTIRVNSAAIFFICSLSCFGQPDPRLPSGSERTLSGRGLRVKGRTDAPGRFHPEKMEP